MLNLLESMKLTGESFGQGHTSPEVQYLIQRIETADPNTETNEDNLWEQWGHTQFASWRASLTSWEAIGSPGTARRLLASIVKTAKVSQRLCELSGKQSRAASCLASCYLQEAGCILWDLWKKSGGVWLCSHVYYSFLTLLHDVAN
jgi:hypothetical protein